MSDLSERARALRERLGLSQEEMADRLGYTRQHYNELEGGKRDWTKRARKSLEILALESDNEASPISDIVSEERPPYRTRPEGLTTGNEAYVRCGRHLEPWLAAAKQDPELAGYFITQLRLHLPLDLLDRLVAGTEPEETPGSVLGARKQLAPPHQRNVRPASGTGPTADHRQAEGA